MKNLNLKLVGVITFSLLSISTFAQQPWRVGGNNNVQLGGNQPIIGTTQNTSLFFHTNSVERMRINANTGATAGFVGINTTNPLYQLHVNASGIANNQLWKRGIMLSDLAALTWHGAPNTNRHYFMGHSSVNPAGNFYQGYSEGIGIGALVNYASTVFVTSNPSSGPIASTQMFKWLFVHEDGFERRFGVNTLNPIRTAEIKNTISNNWQLRLTHQNNAWTDFKTRNTGNLNIQPQNGNTGFNMNLNPTHTIDVNGNARIRNTPVAAIPQSIIIGQQVGVANDRELQRLDFTGNPNDVLLGNGTWGTVQTNLTANNGISINTANQIQLGVPCTVNGFPNIGGVLATQFTENRVIANRDYNLWIISANGETGGVGIGGQPSTSGFCNTGNTLEISANSKNTKYGSTNASGLRLSKLTSASPTIANTINGVDNTKVLTVDSDGDVVLTDAIGGFGSICGSVTPSQLTGNSEIQLTNFDFHFTGNGGTMQQNNVGIGTNCLNPLAGKLHVLQATTDAGTTGAYVLNTDDTSPPTNNSSLGMYVHNSGTTIDLATCRTVAAWFETDLNVDGSQNIAISVPQSGGVVSIGFNAANNAAGNIEPDVCAVFNTGEILEVNGSVYASTGFVGPSDAKFKTNILPITNALNKVKSLNGVYYDYQTANFPNMNFSTNRQVGLIAQNVDTVLTEVVTYDSLLDAYTMDYSKINALLIEAIKEQQNQMDSMNVLVATQDSINADLEGRLATLEACINNIGICNNNGGGNGNGNKVSSQSVTLENLKAIVLDQNLPNPFAESTQINFIIPDDVLNAKLLFYDMSGRIINEVNINERGNGTLTVYGENLEKGIYTYSLIADGKLIATKKMVKK